MGKDQARLKMQTAITRGNNRTAGWLRKKERVKMEDSEQTQTDGQSLEEYSLLILRLFTNNVSFEIISLMIGKFCNLPF